MKIWILQTGEPLHFDYPKRRAIRAINLSNAFLDRNHQVKLISSAFSHQDKKHRSKDFASRKIKKNLQIDLIPSPGYAKNVSLKRLYDHFILGINLYKYLKNTNEKPDFIFIGFPPIEVSAVLTWWAIRKNIPVYLDIKDKWPHYFLTKFPNILKPFISLFLKPYFILAKYSIKQANVITSMSESFLAWACNFSDRNQKGINYLLPLSPPEQNLCDDDKSNSLKFWEEKILNIKNKYVFSFVGSLSKAFNFQLIKELSILFENNTNVIFVICGEGDESKNVRRLFLNANNVFFPGWVNQNQIYGLMQFTKATIAPYLNDSNFIDNLPNKVLDSLLYGKPVISSLEGEVKNLILNNQVGCFCKNEAKSWFNEIMKLLEDQSYYDFLSRNSFLTHEKYFSYDQVYRKFVKVIEQKFKSNKL